MSDLALLAAVHFQSNASQPDLFRN